MNQATVRASRMMVAAGLLTVVGCGGSVQFEDRTAIVVNGTLPKPPPPVEARVQLKEDRITITEKIQFAYNDARILPESFSLLKEIATVIQDNPQVKKIEIGGHASTEGGADHNLRLSKRRADAVMKHLIEKGNVARERLAATGYGVTRPLISPDDSEAKRETNRRVEFLITEQDAKTAAAETAPTAHSE